MNKKLIKILLSSIIMSMLFIGCSEKSLQSIDKVQNTIDELSEKCETISKVFSGELEKEKEDREKIIEQQQEQIKQLQEQIEVQQEQTNSQQEQEVMMIESTPLEIQYDLNPFQLEDAPLLILNSPIDGSAIPTNTYTIEQMAQIIEDINGIEKHRLTFVGYVINDDCTRAYGLFVTDKNTSAEIIPMVVAHEVINPVTNEIVEITNAFGVSTESNQIYIDGEPVPDTLFNDISSVYSMPFVRTMLNQ
jgi:hypothetical protein